jgi:predicted kinase
VSPDWIRENILGESYSYAESANAIVWTLIDAAVRIVLSQGKDVILDGVNLTKSTRKFYVAIARQYGAWVKMVFFSTLCSECVRRNSLAKTHKLPKQKLLAMANSLEVPFDNECDELIIEVGNCPP